MTIMPIVSVTCYASSSRPDPHLIAPCHIRLGVKFERGCDSWKWFEARRIVCFSTTRWGMEERQVQLSLWLSSVQGDTTVTVKDITNVHLLCETGVHVMCFCVLWPLRPIGETLSGLYFYTGHNLNSHIPIRLRWCSAFPFFMTK